MSCCKTNFNASFLNPLGIFLSSLTITSANNSSSEFFSSTLIVFMYSTAAFIKAVGSTSGSSTKYVRTKIAKIRPPSPLVRNRTHLA